MAASYALSTSAWRLAKVLSEWVAVSQREPQRRSGHFTSLHVESKHLIIVLPGLLLLLVLDDMPFDMEGNMETSHSLVFRGFIKFSAESGSVSQKGPHGEEGAHHPRVSPLCLTIDHSQWASTGKKHLLFLVSSTLCLRYCQALYKVWCCI